MSIIYDALKKAQESISPNSKQSANLKTPNPLSKLKIILLYVLIMGAGLAISNIIFSFVGFPAVKKPVAKNIKPTPNLTAKEKPKVENIVGTQPPAALIAAPGTQSAKQFILSGVFFSQDEGYALINNQIVKKGDIVDDAVVLSIGLNGVELNSGGVTLKIIKSK